MILSGLNHYFFMKTVICFFKNHGILDERGRPTVKVAQVKGHASDEMIANGSARRQDKDGKEAADRAADLGQPEQFISVRRRIQNASNFWYPIVCEQQRFFIAVAGLVVNDDG